MKYDKDRGGYVLSKEELADLNAKMEKARDLAENLALYEQLRLCLPLESRGKKLLN